MTIRETWRAAALRDQVQFLGIYDPFLGRTAPGHATHSRPIGENERGHCALTILGPQDDFKAQQIVCPACGVEKWGHPTDLMIHLNNLHHWGWLDLANKFPPILPEDQV